MGDMEIVDEAAPLGVVGPVRAYEPSQVRAIDGQLDELIARRMTEPLLPHTQPFPGQISIEERVVEGTPIVLTPAMRVEMRDGLRVGRSCWPILDHPTP
jgi:hypothetical protein